MIDSTNTGQVAMTLRHGQSVSLVHPDGTVCVVAPTPKQVGKCHIVIIAPKAVRIERDKETADEIEQLEAALLKAINERNEAKERNVRLLSQLQEYEVREL
jgi:hypothetical protein